MSKYMFILTASGIVPFVLSFWPPLKFWRNARALAGSIAVVVVVFGGWDILAVYFGHWDFAPDAVWSARLVNLPVEEVLFFVIIPFCSIFTWEVINYFTHRRK